MDKNPIVKMCDEKFQPYLEITATVRINFEVIQHIEAFGDLPRLYIMAGDEANRQVTHKTRVWVINDQ